MSRQEEIENKVMEFAAQKLECAVKQITDYYKEHDAEIKEDFFRAIGHGLQQCVESKKKIGFITISILESSMITKTYDLQIAFSNAYLYAGDNPVYEYWAPSFIYNYLDSDIEEMERSLKDQVIRLKPYEVLGLKRQYVTNLYFLIGFMMKGMAPEIAGLCKYQETDREKIVKVLFGKYMEKQTEICSLGA